MIMGSHVIVYSRDAEAARADTPRRGNGRRNMEKSLGIQPAGGGRLASQKLARAGIYLSPSILPLNDKESELHGLRIGTQEITRRGLGFTAFKRLAQIMAAVIRDEIDPGVAADDVARLVNQAAHLES